jgi:4'-phosphopantetheinyl transferase
LDDVHVHVVDLRRWSAADEARCLELLSDAERRRAERFLVPAGRSCFTICRAVLRRVLGAAIHRDPTTLIFGYGLYGKPYLALDADGPLPLFNVSHSGELGIIAVADGLELGADVERVRHFNDMHRIARRFFSAAEVAALEAVPEADFDRAFFRCWTRKEAFIKAIGEGFSRPLASFDVDFASDDGPGAIRVADAPEESARWTVMPLAVPAGYVAALAATERRRIVMTSVRP